MKYEVVLTNNHAFTIDTDVDIDNLHELLFNEDGLIMFSLYDGKRVLLRASEIAALWEE